jgi:glycine betaine catabolism B
MNIAYYRNLVILAGAGPLLMLAWDAWQGQLGANGVNNALHITGILSLVFLFISLMVTPLRVLTGWNSLVAYRRALGLYGFVYAALHFVIYFAFDRMGSIASTVEEILTRRFLTVGFVAIALMLPLAVTSTNGMIKRLGPGRWKLLHRLAYLATILGVVHYYMLVKSDVRQPLAFAAVLTPILGFRSVKHYLDLRRSANKIRTVAPSSNAVRKFWKGELLVANICQETHDVNTFRFVATTGGEIPFVHFPGQYMTLTLPIDGEIVRRSYTIASASTQHGYVELSIKRNPQGQASRYMHDRIKVGDKIQIGAPAGKFYFDHPTAKGVVLIAGGVGITPLMSILRTLTDRVWGGNIYFINAVKSRDDLIFAQELSMLVERFENLRVLTCYSQDNSIPKNMKSNERALDKQGYLDAANLSAFVPELSALPVFLCGPLPMMQAVREVLVTLGVPNTDILTEEFASPKASSSETADSIADVANSKMLSLGNTATISFAKSGQTTEIDATNTILEAAEQAGVSLPFECRSGICGQCKVKCSSGKVHMSSRDAITKLEESQGYILACQSHPIDETITIEA